MKKSFGLKTSLYSFLMLLILFSCVYGCLDQDASYETLKSVTPNKLEYAPFDIYRS